MKADRATAENATRILVGDQPAEPMGDEVMADEPDMEPTVDQEADDDFAAKFFTTLWKLRLLGGYNRSSLPDRISNIIKGRKVAYIRRIHDGEFVKLAEVAE